MALLEVKELDKVKFGDIEEVPNVDAELDLRIRELRCETKEDIEEAKEVLASAFPQNKAKVIAYLNKPTVLTFEILRLKAYLEGGESAVNAYDNSFSEAISKVLDKNA